MPVYTYAAGPISGQGTWEGTLKGRDLDGDLSNGFEAYYDTDLDMTWLVTANLPGLLDGNSGLLSWVDAKAYVQQFSIGGVEGWRMPSVKPINGVSFDRTKSNLGDTDIGTNIRSTQSELSHLFYVTLGNKAEYPALVLGGPDVEMVNNTGPFYDLGFQTFWFNEVGDAFWQDGWHFSFSGGNQNDNYRKSNCSKCGAATNLVWFVHSGDVGSAVPEPQTYALALAGVAALLGVRKRLKA